MRQWYPRQWKEFTITSVSPGQPVRCLRQGKEAGHGNGREGKEESSKRAPRQMEGEHVEEDVANVLR